MAKKMRWLSTKGTDIIDDKGRTVLLKGYCLGGWLNTENFINGYPFTDHMFRQALADVLGAEKAAYYYERHYEHYLQEADVEFLAECGTNCVRLPLNYRLFESDLAPGKYLPDGFEYVDRLVKWCRAHRIYVIIELHSAQGWQNPDWHCDNPADVCLLWGSADYQKRVANLWKAIAKRYADEPAVAGYEILNEPVAPDVPTLQAFYEKVSKKIRKADKKHIIFWEGNVFGTQFDGLSLPGRNMAFSCHIYTAADFEDFAYPTADNNKETIAKQYKGYADFARKQNAPMWCSEWGAHQLGRTPEIRKGRLRAVEDQIEIFEGHGHSWSLWTYKDVGVMGLAMPKKSSDYMKRTRAVQKLKAQLGVDVWTADHAAFAKWTKPVLEHVKKTCGKRVPPEVVHKITDRAIRDACGRLLMAPFAEQFRGMTKRQIDSMLKSWRFENCRINKGLARVIKRHSA